jgi:hypothetical protein
LRFETHCYAQYQPDLAEPLIDGLRKAGLVIAGDMLSPDSDNVMGPLPATARGEARALRPSR